METKKFYLTSEFWITVAAVITAFITAVSDAISHDLALILGGVAAAAYTLSRGFAKAGVAPVEDDSNDSVNPNT